MRKIVYFFGESARRRKRKIHPADAIVATGRVGRGREKGGETCWRWGQRLALRSRREFFGGWGVNFQPVGAPNSQLLRPNRTRK
jgi:hypothetical protein